MSAAETEARHRDALVREAELRHRHETRSLVRLHSLEAVVLEAQCTECEQAWADGFRIQECETCARVAAKIAEAQPGDRR